MRLRCLFSVTKRRPLLVFLGVFLIAHNSFSQSLQQTYPGGNFESKAGIDKGIDLYSEGRWGEAVVALRRAQQLATSNTQRGEAQFWIGVAELSAGDYYGAIHDLDEIGRIDPQNIRRLEIPYHKGRALYYLGKYNEAIPLLRTYADSIHIDGRYANGIRTEAWTKDASYGNEEGDYNRKAAALYWIGECYYSMGELRRAEEVFNTIIEYYTKSHKYEPSTNRIALIKQKKIEVELLELLKYSNEEKNLNVFRDSDRDGNRNPVAPSAMTQAPAPVQSPTAPGAAAEPHSNYDDAILAYQNRIAPYLLKEALEESRPMPERSQPAPQRGLTLNDYTTNPQSKTPQDSAQRKLSGNDPDVVMRLLAVKTTALEMMDRLVSTLNSYEVIEAQRWSE